MPYIGEDILLSYEEGNVYDKHAVAASRGDSAVASAVSRGDSAVARHPLREISHVFWFSCHNTEVPVKAILHLSRSFTCNSFHMTATFSLAHAFDI